MTFRHAWDRHGLGFPVMIALSVIACVNARWSYAQQPERDGDRAQEQAADTAKDGANDSAKDSANLAAPGQAQSQNPNKVQVRLKNGDYVSGTILSSKERDRLSLKSPAFDTPLDLSIDSIGSVKREEEQADNGNDDFVFIFRNNSTIVGKLIALTKEAITIQSASLGEVTLPRALLSEWVARHGAGKPFFAGPKFSQAWVSPSKVDAWKVEGGCLTTSVPGHPVHCDAAMPLQCEVRLSISWTKAPGFAIALGTVEKSSEPGSDQDAASVRLESWGNELVMIREVEKTMDLVALGDLSDNGGRVSLTLFIDEKKGEVIACSQNGAVLGRVNAKKPGRVPTPNPFVRLLNTETGSEALRLERISVRPWNGVLNSEVQANQSGIVEDDNKFYQGTLGAYDASTRSLSFESDQAAPRAVPLDKLSRAVFAADATPAPTPEESVEVLFADDSACIGVWNSRADGKLELQLLGVDQPLEASFDAIIGLSGNSKPYAAPDRLGRTGILEAREIRLTGYLDESNERGAIAWHADCCQVPTRLSLEFEGRVFYEPSTFASNDTNENASSPRLPNIIQRFMGNARGPQQTIKPGVAAITTGLHFRTGDVIDGKVQYIDERGVTYSVDSKTNTVPHDKLESVTLVSRAHLTELAPEKLKHLTTIPRAAKADPPTHLFISVDGDYLRGRLVKYENGRVTAEIRLENVEFPANSIAQIYWLHSRDWDTTAKQDPKSKDAVAETEPDATTASTPAPATTEPVLLMHALQRQAKGMTFVPKQITKGTVASLSVQTITGHSDLLGECEVRIGRVEALLIGRDVGALVRAQQKDSWKLSVAPLPKVYQEGEQTAESGSPLVGQLAPDFTLPTTSGSLTLKELRGRVVVLDFWASWCGPCMQTMPEVDRIVHEVGEKKVELVAVNLQETKERVEAAVKRLELTATVALDDDGEVAEKYQASAIPQTVIIDRQGKVTHVFVGGGSRFLKQFAEALKSTLAE